MSLTAAARRSATALLAAVLLSTVLTACSWPWSKGDSGSGVSVMDAQVGECFLNPTEVNVQVPSLEKVDCDSPHDRELYAKPTYDDGGSDDYPGDDAMAQFGESACAEKFIDYVGVSYLDSALYFTYLVPSARSWQDTDRDALCFVLSPGEQLTGTVRGSEK